MRSPISLLPALTLLVALPALASPPDAPSIRVTHWPEFATVTVEEFHGGSASGRQALAGSEGLTTERLALALGPVAPNPGRGSGLVANVVLPSADPAQLELLDVMGRRLASLELGALGAGRHAVELGAGLHLAPGVYLLRLTQAGSARVTRVAITD
jgi:hypothetical protein